MDYSLSHRLVRLRKRSVHGCRHLMRCTTIPATPRIGRYYMQDPQKTNELERRRDHDFAAVAPSQMLFDF